MGHQAQVVFNELVAGLQVALGGQLQAPALLFRFQGAGEGAGLAAGKAQGKQQAVQGEDQTGWQHGDDLLRNMKGMTVYPILRRPVPNTGRGVGISPIL